MLMLPQLILLFLFVRCKAVITIEDLFVSNFKPISLKRFYYVSFQARTQLTGYQRNVIETKEFSTLGLYKQNDQSPVSVFRLLGIISWGRPQETYKNFFSILRHYACVVDGKDCCDMRSGCVPTKFTSISYIFNNAYTDPAMYFLRIWCSKQFTYNPSEEEIYDNIIPFCPDTCAATPCEKVLNVVHRFACTPTGVYVGEYKCQCKQGYSWDPIRHRCTLTDQCLGVDGFSPCSIVGTMKCISFGINKYECICKTGYFGVQCETKLNACINRPSKKIPSGNEVCDVEKGHKCHAVVGTNQYQCECREGYGPDYRLGSNNCKYHYAVCLPDYEEKWGLMGRIANASAPFYKYIPILGGNNYIPKGIEHKDSYSLISHDCLNMGKCIMSRSQQTAICICSKDETGSRMFEGEHCEYPLGIWSEWSEPTSCFPKGHELSKYRWRRRICVSSLMQKFISPRDAMKLANLNYIAECPGTSEEILQCEDTTHPETMTFPGFLIFNIDENFKVFLFFLCSLIEFLVSLIIWKTITTEVFLQKVINIWNTFKRFLKSTPRSLIGFVASFKNILKLKRKHNIHDSKEITDQEVNLLRDILLKNRETKLSEKKVSSDNSDSFSEDKI